MKRIFVNIKTNPRLGGTLFEINGESTVSDTLEKIVCSMEDMNTSNEHGQPPEYRLVRLGSPNRILDNHQTFINAHISNSDILLMIPDADINSYEGHFNFIPLSINEQDISVQDLRVPIRPPLARISSEKETTEVFPLRTSLPKSVDSPLPGNISSETEKTARGSFEFQKLDIDLPEGERKEEKSRTPPDSTGRKRKGKNIVSGK